jgi:hypothetical protein
MAASSPQSQKLSFRIQSIYEIEYDLIEALKYFEQYFTPSTHLPKKKQTDIKELKIKLAKNNNQELFYSFHISSKIGYHPNNLLS